MKSNSKDVLRLEKLTVNERLYMKRKIKMIREFVHDKGVSRLRFQNLSAGESYSDALYMLIMLI